MGEYVRYGRTEIKIGTCEDLYYATYQAYVQAYKDGKLSWVDHNLPPAAYMKADSGFRFRFPFPDEDHIRMGMHDDYDRGLPVKVNFDFDSEQLLPKGQGPQVLEIVQQKLIHRQKDNQLCLAIVLRNPEKGNLFRLEDDNAIDQLMSSIITHHILFENDPAKKQFYKTIAQRLLKGYRLEEAVRQRYAPKRTQHEGLGGGLSPH